ncbi:MAG: glycosyltransferase family 2 protein [Clostridia bacterium]|nr:glycosyltransferase family 2 protein [Clostridia bacterium]
MKYSVIIPAYNCEKTIEATVKSVLVSGLSDFEIVIVNDGSKDNTKAVCDKLAEAYKEVKCIHKENGGVSSARNLGIDEASGEYLLFMDSDDTYKSDGFKKINNLLNEGTADLIVFGLSFNYYKGDKIYRSDVLAYPTEGVLKPSQWSEDFATLFESNSLSSACNKVFKARIIKENKLYFNKNVFLMEDFLFVLEYLRHTEQIHLIADALYHYRQPEDEMHAYVRTERISDINAYLTPFYEASERLALSLNDNFNLTFPQGEDVLFNLYKMLISQKAYYADTDTLKSLTETIKNGRFANFDTDDILINDLKNENYKAIIKRHKKIQLRHKIAVTVKKTALYQKLRGN